IARGLAIRRRPFRETRPDLRAASAARAPSAPRSSVPPYWPPRQNSRGQCRPGRAPAPRPRALPSLRPDTIPSARGHLRESQSPRDNPPPPSAPARCHSTTPLLLLPSRDPSFAPPATPAALVAQPVLLALSSERAVRHLLHSELALSSPP